jgi:hypothetical protein
VTQRYSSNFITPSNRKEVKINGIELFKKNRKRTFVGGVEGELWRDRGGREESNKGSNESSHIQDINL